jgi:fatty acid/phospholipid biosynthesis enzyme
MGYPNWSRPLKIVNIPGLVFSISAKRKSKGNEQVKHAAKLLAETHINFLGFVEGNDIFAGTVDVVVTDGFTG